MNRHEQAHLFTAEVAAHGVRQKRGAALCECNELECRIKLLFSSSTHCPSCLWLCKTSQHLLIQLNMQPGEPLLWEAISPSLAPRINSQDRVTHTPPPWCTVYEFSVHDDLGHFRVINLLGTRSVLLDSTIPWIVQVWTIHVVAPATEYLPLQGTRWHYKAFLIVAQLPPQGFVVVLQGVS